MTNKHANGSETRMSQRTHGQTSCIVQHRQVEIRGISMPGTALKRVDSACQALRDLTGV